MMEERGDSTIKRKKNKNEINSSYAKNINFSYAAPKTKITNRQPHKT